MTGRAADPRLARPAWRATGNPGTRARVLLLTGAGIVLAGWYFAWLLTPERVGHPVLYGFLVAAELFNLAQAGGFWWTCVRDSSRRPRRSNAHAAVDVFIPVFNEPVEIVEATISGA